MVVWDGREKGGGEGGGVTPIRVRLDPLPHLRYQLRLLCLILHDQRIKLNLSGNEVHYSACSLLLTLKNSCSKVHCQKGINLIFFSYEIVCETQQQQVSSLVIVPASDLKAPP